MGKSPFPFDFVYGVCWRGVVTDGVTGRPNAATVRAIPRNAGSSVVAPTAEADAGGRFEIVGVGTGPYTVRANGSGNANNVYAVAPVEPGNADIENIALTLSTGFTLTGRIVIEGQSATGDFRDFDVVAINVTPENSFLPAPRVAANGADVTVTGLYSGDYRFAATTKAVKTAPQPSVIAAATLTINPTADPKMAAPLQNDVQILRLTYSEGRATTAPIQ